VRDRAADVALRPPLDDQRVADVPAPDGVDAAAQRRRVRPGRREEDVPVEIDRFVRRVAVVVRAERRVHEPAAAARAGADGRLDDRGHLRGDGALVGDVEDRGRADGHGIVNST
jgi:hypothetical protein